MEIIYEVGDRMGNCPECGSSYYIWNGKSNVCLDCDGIFESVGPPINYSSMDRDAIIDELIRLRDYYFAMAKRDDNDCLWVFDECGQDLDTLIEKAANEK